MSRFFNNPEVGSGTAFRDIVLAILLAVVSALIILLIQPREVSKSETDHARARGNIRVELFWPNDMDVDVDLWGKAPGLPAVGYSNMNGVILNLVRDDLGSYADITGINYEVMFSRGLPQGEWVFNAHMFRNASGKRVVPIKVIITHRTDDGSGSKEQPKQIIATTLKLTKMGQEMTIIRFKLDADGVLVPGSMNSVPKHIRSINAGDN